MTVKSLLILRRFSEAVVLENGYTVVTLRAEDRYGRSRIIEKSFVYARFLLQ